MMDRSERGGPEFFDPIGLDLAFVEPPRDGESEEEQPSSFEALDSPFAEAFDVEALERSDEGFEPLALTGAEEAFGEALDFEASLETYEQGEAFDPLSEWEEGEERYERGAELFEEEYLTDNEDENFSSEQLDFRSRVLAAHIASKRRKPYPDLDGGKLKPIAGTDQSSLPGTAAAAERLLAAANAALREARARGDTDALRTRRITVSSGYRSGARQRGRWMELFPKYYGLTQAARERLAGGAHGKAAVSHMVNFIKGKIAPPGFSNHQGGTAIDLWQERVRGQRVANSTTKAARAKWRSTWLYRWLTDEKNGARFGFKQLATEEWHWEFQGERGASEAAPSFFYEAVGPSPSAGQLWTYQSSVTGGQVALFAPPAALNIDRVDLLLFVHGLLGPCPKLRSVPDGFITSTHFSLGKIVSDSGRSMVVAVPLMQEGNDRSWKPLGLERPSTLNAFVSEAMGEVSRRLGRSQQLSDFILAGHSRAFGVIYPLAKSQDRARSEGPLARLKGLWLLDATYGSVPLRELRTFSTQGPQVRIIYRRGTATDKFNGRKSSGSTQLRPVSASIGHCPLPRIVLPALLRELSGNPSPGVVREQPFGEDRDVALARSTSTEWTEAGLTLEGFEGEEFAEEAFAEEAPDARAEALDTEQLAWLNYEAEAESAELEDHPTLESAEFEWESFPNETALEFFDEAETLEGLEPGAMEALDHLLEHEAEDAPGLAARLKDGAAFLLGPTLRRGARGAGVSALQRALSSLGESLVIDGVFGAGTDAAVRRFQSRSGLSPDGVVGPQTKAAIGAALGGGRIPKPSPSPAPIPPSPVPPAPTPPRPDDGQSVEDFATALAGEWSRLSGGKINAETKRADLITDYQRTVEGARRRFGTKYGEETIRRAWKISRQNEMLFKTDQSPQVKPLGPFAPPASRVQLTSDPSIPGSKDSPVAPATIRFVAELKRRSPKSSATTYPKHGSQGFVDRGYSLDLWIPGRDDRGFYRPADAIQFLREVGAAAKSINAQWRIIYNDFSVADAINKELGRRHVIFVGHPNVDKQGRVSLNWHGPEPLILHFHLDLAVAEGAQGEDFLVLEPESQETEARYEDKESFDQLSDLETLFSSEADAGSSVVDRLKGVAEFLIGPPLKRGDSGPAVAALQRALGRLGFDLAADGSFGPNTDRAVRGFQQQQGLSADGIVGAATKAALAASLRKGGVPLPVPLPQPAPTPVVPGKKLSPTAFTQAFRDAARRSETTFRVPTLVTLGQAALESGWGERAPRYNFFGIKARATDPEHSRQLMRTREVLSRPDARFPEVISVTPRPDGKYEYVVRDWFRAYPNADAAFESHGRLLSTKKNYARAFDHVGDAYAFAVEVFKGGYATDPSYVRVLHSVMRMIEKTGLV